MPKPATEPPQPINLSVNTVVDGKLIPADDPLPFAADNVPPSLQLFVVTDDEPELEESNACFELNTVYQLNSEGRIGRALSRQVAQLEAEAERQDWAEGQLSAYRATSRWLLAASLQGGHARDHAPVRGYLSEEEGPPG
jgi:hypothetical protein